MNPPNLSRRQVLAVAACACCPCLAVRDSRAAQPAAGAGPSLTAPCGIYCGACPALIASLAPGKKRSDKPCHGCWSQAYPPGYASKCAVRKCARTKKVQSCGQCKRYPCELLPPLFNDQPKYGLREKYLNAVRDRGLDAWLADQKKRWTCAKCGKGFGYGDKQCPSCGGDILTDAAEFAAFKPGRT